MFIEDRPRAIEGSADGQGVLARRNLSDYRDIWASPMAYATLRLRTHQ